MNTNTENDNENDHRTRNRRIDLPSSSAHHDLEPMSTSYLCEDVQPDEPESRTENIGLIFFSIVCM